MRKVKVKLISLIFFIINLNSKTLLITGGAGFIGSNFLEYMYNKHPDYKFKVVDILNYSGSLDNIEDYIKKSNRFQFIYGSICDPYLIDDAIQGCDYIVHFAAESHVTRSLVYDLPFFETEIMGTRTLAKLALKNKIKRFIHISSSEVCGTAELKPMNEDHPVNPRTPYAAAKLGAEKIIYSYVCSFGLPAVIVRPFNNFGPKQHPEKVLPRFITSIIKGDPIIIHGDGFQTRDWVHTTDIARALDKILHLENFNNLKGNTIHLGSGKETSILNIAKRLYKIFGIQENIQFVEDRPGQVQSHISSVEKAQKLLNWRASELDDNVLKNLINWYKENEDWWKPRYNLSQIPVHIGNHYVLQ